LDNNHILATDTSVSKLFREIKEIPLTKNEHPVVLSIGGEIREQIRAYNHLEYGDAVPDQDFYLLQRYMIHADLRINKTFRLFTQFNSTHVDGKNSIGANDKDNLGVMQAFVDVNLPSHPMSFRFGRQELLYGSERMIGVRDGPNNRQSFDGFKYTIHSKKITADLLLLRPVNYEPGFFDNTINTQSLVFGSYWIIQLKNNNILDLYFLGNNRKNAHVEDVTSDENRYSIGTRLSKSVGSFFYDTEATWQTGTFDHHHILAWHATAITGYRWQNAWLSPRLQIKGSVFTGDKNSTDNQLNIFRAISAKPPVNDMLRIGPTNIILFAPEGEIRVMKRLGLVLKYFAIWRFRTTDGLYSTDMERMIREPDIAGKKNGRYVGGGPAVELNYTARKHFNATLTLGNFSPGEYLKNTSKGMNLQGLQLKTYYRF
jgi:hypothetical protein